MCRMVILYASSIVCDSVSGCFFSCVSSCLSASSFSRASAVIVTVVYPLRGICYSARVLCCLPSR